MNTAVAAWEAWGRKVESKNKSVASRNGIATIAPMRKTKCSTCGKEFPERDRYCGSGCRVAAFRKRTKGTRHVKAKRTS